MRYVTGVDRSQASLLPASLEEYVASGSSVRVIEAFVDGLNVAELGFGRAVPATTGRPPYNPRDLLKLYIYGYFNEVRSSRRLERECRRNVELMWLLRRLVPDFKTIADFRRDNGQAIIGACRAFVTVCRQAGLFQARLIALDGSKFRAAASGKKVMGRKDIAAEAAQLDRRINDYLAGLDTADKAEPGDAPDAVASALAALKERRAELDRLAARLDAEERTTVVDGEEDARPMGYAPGRKPPSYNVQTAVDVESGLIVHYDVTNEPTDNRLLHPMAKAAKQAVHADKITVVADAGYSNGSDAAACEADGITPCAPANRAVNNQGDGTLFDRSAFTYDAQSDTFQCPAGRRLLRKQLHRAKANVIYAAPAADCAACPLKPRCTPHERRLITRHLHDDALTRMTARIEADPSLMRKRRCAAEHPFGTIKRMMAGGRFLTRNLKGTRTEMALSVLAYNLLRAINRKMAAS